MSVRRVPLELDVSHAVVAEVRTARVARGMTVGLVHGLDDQAVAEVGGDLTELSRGEGGRDVGARRVESDGDERRDRSLDLLLDEDVKAVIHRAPVDGGQLVVGPHPHGLGPEELLERASRPASAPTPAGSGERA